MTEVVEIDAFQIVRINLADGYVTYECGYRAPIVDMWDEEGEYTLDFTEARAIGWIPAGDHGDQYRLVKELDKDEEEDVN